MRRSSNHVCRAAPALRDDLHGIFGWKAPASPWPPRVTSSTGSAWGSQPSARTTAFNSAAWTTKTPASFPLPFLIHPASGNGHPPPSAFSRHPSGGNRLPPGRHATWISSGKHLDFLLPVGPGRPRNRLGRLLVTTAWPLRCRPGSGSKSAAGTPPILTRHGWLIIYHGVCEMTDAGGDGHHCATRRGRWCSRRIIPA